MSNLAMAVTGLPPGIRVTQLTREHVSALTGLVHTTEMTYFGRSDTNDKEMLGTLAAPELEGARGTAGLWQDDELLAVLLAFNGLEHERGLFLDLFVSPFAPDRQGLASRLLDAGERYGGTLSTRPGDRVKVESHGGDTQVADVLSQRGYERHRIYLRMRVDFDGPVDAPAALSGLRVEPMAEHYWADLHAVVTRSFRDHYDSHPLPLEVFRENMLNETTDLDRWRLVLDGPRCVAVCIGSLRYAQAGLGYVETLGVLREYRSRGIGRHLLLDAMARDSAKGLSGTSLHCDATNPTGATQLYESVGMHRDHEYLAWHAPLQDRGRFAAAHTD